jgi:two-component system, NtrC family, sensor kinase
MLEIPSESRRILVIDDEEAARYGIGKALEREGYQVEMAPNGKEALQKIQIFVPQTIISDINMPEMDGLSLLRVLSQQGLRIPVILVTAYGSESLAIEALRAGAYDYLTKPFEIEDLRTVVRNALERSILQEENRRQFLQLEKALKELRETQDERIYAEKMASLGRLVAGFAHELNSPLGALASSLDTIDRTVSRLQNDRRGPVDQPSSQDHERLLPAMKEAMDVARKACHRVDSLMRTLRHFSNLDQAPRRSIDVRDCVENTLALMSRELGQEIVVTKALGDVPLVECYPMDLNQVLMNLLLNAKEAIAGKGEVLISTWSSDTAVIIEIRDNGRGIPPDQIEKVFEPGFTTKGSGIGTGMGLPLCRRIMHRHQGSIGIKSQPGVGTNIILEIPKTGSSRLSPL